MKKKSILVILAVAIIANSCGSMSMFPVRLLSVESPKDARQTFGETNIVNMKEGKTDKSRYEDDFIEIVWSVSRKQFNFELKNKSNHTIRINWDDISYVDTKGKVGRVMHNGVKYIERNNSQPSTSVPRGATISDLLLPTDNVYNINGYWFEKNLISTDYNERQGKKTMSVLMPIMIENVQNDYVFVFEVEI